LWRCWFTISCSGEEKTLEDSKENQENAENQGLPRRFFLLLATGMILVFAGALVIFAAAIAGGGGSTSGGVVIFIGPIPIVFGTGPDAGLLVLAGAILSVVIVALFVFWRRRLVVTAD
jgi:uncharacterized membrane protein